ncbi:MAG: hypothetical protein K6E12_06725 [Saccharofermentans sp.]|nr:hypothetical protein [Saccharofermentans sp.]
MILTLILSFAGCVLLFLCIWGVTVTMPTPLLAKNFPVDVQECLKPRLESLPMSFIRVIGWIILVAFCVLYIGIFVFGAIDGIANNYNFWQFFLRFFLIGGIIKVFDIVCLDYVLLTKTHFFQHYFPETKDCIGWKKFGYNRKQQAGQCLAIAIMSPVLAFVCSLF